VRRSARGDLGPDVGERRGADAFVGPTGPHHHRDRTVRAERRELAHNGVEGGDGEIVGERRARLRERGEPLFGMREARPGTRA
jgi:hypothetical protein